MKIILVLAAFIACIHAQADPATQKLIDNIFVTFAVCGNGDQDETDPNWFNYTWRAGGPREYYENFGPADDLQACINMCQRQRECYFATLTPTRQCWGLNTNHPTSCKYFTTGHFGKLIEQCTPVKPCYSAYRVCKNPKCTLESIMDTYCGTKGMDHSVTKCILGYQKNGKEKEGITGFSVVNQG